jgi:hypothetical protein
MDRFVPIDQEKRAVVVLIYPPLENVVKPVLTTGEAGHYLDRASQTMRKWAATGEGPIKPLRINGRLAWPTAAVKKLTGVTA